MPTPIVVSPPLDPQPIHITDETGAVRIVAPALVLYSIWINVAMDAAESDSDEVVWSAYQIALLNRFGYGPDVAAIPFIIEIVQNEYERQKKTCVGSSNSPTSASTSTDTLETNSPSSTECSPPSNPNADSEPSTTAPS